MGMMVCFHVPFVELTNIIPSQYHYERCKRGYRQVKVGIIRCRQTEDMCPGTTDFKIAASGACAFEDMGPVEIVGFLSCGAAPVREPYSERKCWLTEAQKQSSLRPA